MEKDTAGCRAFNRIIIVAAAQVALQRCPILLAGIHIIADLQTAYAA